MDSSMDMEEIRTFVTIVRTRSFSRAATLLHRSQPAISRRIELLEQELGAPLFERVARGAILTGAGSAFLPHAEAVLASAKDAAAAVREVQKGEVGTVSLALVGTLANDRMTGILQRFIETHPRIRLDLRTANSEEIGELVQRGDADLGLRYLVDRNPALISIPAGEERLLVVGSSDHPLARRRGLEPKSLRGERWIAFPSRRSRESFARFLERRLSASGLELQEIIPVDSLTAQKSLVAAGFGLALIAESGIQEEVRSGKLKVIDVPALKDTIQITLVRRRNGYLSAAAQNLMETITTASRPLRPARSARVGKSGDSRRD
jgi:DNA-binding transcriptional LysR family regulator